MRQTISKIKGLRYRTGFMSVSLAAHVTAAQGIRASLALNQAARNVPSAILTARVRQRHRTYQNLYTNHAHGAPAP